LLPLSLAEQVPSGPITVFVQLPGSNTCEVIDTTGPLVGHLKKAIIAEFKLDVAPQQLQLFKLDDKGSSSSSSSKALEPTLTLAEADLLSATGGPIKLHVVRVEAARVAAGECCYGVQMQPR
jgi:hypothetical protein